jgi:hypothetical protein
VSHSDDVREHCRTQIIGPARVRGAITAAIRAGDVHKALGYKNRMPLVCSALGSKLFEQACQVERVSVDGPLNGANATFTFRL